MDDVMKYLAQAISERALHPAMMNDCPNVRMSDTQVSNAEISINSFSINNFHRGVICPNFLRKHDVFFFFLDFQVAMLILQKK